MSLKIYNTMSRKKEEFVSIEPSKVRMYLCGPTVYDFLHVGNFFGAIFFNLVRNWLEKSGYQVTFVYNYTDVDDKIINRANKDGVQSEDITKKYIAEFEKDFANLKLRKHTHNPKVTDYIPQIISFIEDLVKKEKAYVLNGDVYFNVPGFPGYGKLSNKNLDDLVAGTRVEINDQKRHVTDFALWKKSKPGEPSWQSPWGDGRPGWHIECSCMANELLGETIDIHGGGLDLTFPHHENEIAQSESKTGKQFAKYWMHNNMLVFSNQKMSKSLGNVRTGRSFMEEFGPEVLKFLILSSHYRSNVDFSAQQIDRAIGTLGRIYSSLSLSKRLAKSKGALVPVPEIFQKALDQAQVKITESLNDDFNTPEVMAAFFEVMRQFNQLCKKPGAVTPQMAAIAETYGAWLKHQGAMMALFQEEPDQFLVEMDNLLLKKKSLQRDVINKLVEERTNARTNKDYKRGDEIRQQLMEMGIAVQDSTDGTYWEVDKSVV